MKASSQVVLADELPARLESASNLVAFGQIIDLVSAGRMRLDRENLTVHPKATDAVVGAELEGRKKQGFQHVVVLIRSLVNAKNGRFFDVALGFLPY